MEHWLWIALFFIIVGQYATYLEIGAACRRLDKIVSELQELNKTVTNISTDMPK